MKSKGINSTDRNNNSADIRFYETKVLSRFSVLLLLQIIHVKCKKEHNFIDFYIILFQKL